MRSIIGVYVDAGASVATVVRAVTQEVGTSYVVRAVVAEHLDEEKFFDALSVFVMPGGADLPYCAKLNGERNERLRRWVEGGGVYLGLCAGGYYGCSSIIFHGDGSEIVGDRELGFLQGTAIGSIKELAPLYDFTIKSAAVAHLVSDEGESAAFYNGGSFFKIRKDTNAKVLARYRDVTGNPPAIVETRVSAGKAILCGVHPEVSYNELSLQVRSV
jgi:glutamine amidotransferase-like uncharacterized protein